MPRVCHHCFGQLISTTAVTRSHATYGVLLEEIFPCPVHKLFFWHYVVITIAWYRYIEIATAGTNSIARGCKMAVTLYASFISISLYLHPVLHHKKRKRQLAAILRQAAMHTWCSFKNQTISLTRFLNQTTMRQVRKRRVHVYN